jgi:hypothetical protein
MKNADATPFGNHGGNAWSQIPPDTEITQV